MVLGLMIMIGVLAVAGAPFLATMSLAARIAGLPRRAVRPALAGPVWFMLATPAVFVSNRWWRWNLDDVTLALLFAAGSLGGAWAVWRLTRRASLTAGLIGWSAGAGPLFLFLESLTHGPYYIRSEALAILAAAAVTASFWHAGVLGAMLLWARWAGRRDARRRSGMCLRCGYDLRGLNSLTCPECGTPSSPPGTA